jgi:phosphoglycolate phosphatase
MRHWVFDLDGTLVDSFGKYFALMGEIFAAHGRRFETGMHREALTESLEAMFEKHLGRENVARAFEVLRARSNEDARDIRPFAGMEGFLAELRTRGARIAVWTNRDLVSASLILEHSGLKGMTEAIVSGTCVSARKPHPEGLVRLIERFGCEPGEVTMVGDHPYDVEGAKAAGARAVRASWHGYWDDEECPVADAQFRRVADFHAWARGSAVSRA